MTVSELRKRLSQAMDGCEEESPVTNVTGMFRHDDDSHDLLDLAVDCRGNVVLFFSKKKI